jgi:ArsR family transcriptional regulator, arsenate/arsenite/antimonite-responsive transcriptional repressor
MAFSKSNQFSEELQGLSVFCSALAHPARIAILKFLAEQKTCFSGDLSSHLPLSASTVSQHLTELKNLGLICGTVNGVRVSYCINFEKWNEYKILMSHFFAEISDSEFTSCKNC